MKNVIKIQQKTGEKLKLGKNKSKNYNLVKKMIKG